MPGDAEIPSSALKWLAEHAGCNGILAVPLICEQQCTLSQCRKHTSFDADCSASGEDHLITTFLFPKPNICTHPVQCGLQRQRRGHLEQVLERFL